MQFGKSSYHLKSHDIKNILNFLFQVQTRDAKIKRYKQAKELKDKLSNLSRTMVMPNVDDETKRDYFITLLLCYINQALDELASIDQEKPILDYMDKQTGRKL